MADGHLGLWPLTFYRRDSSTSSLVNHDYDYNYNYDGSVGYFDGHAA